MICNVILTFILLFADGHKENRTKWVDKDTAKELKSAFVNPRFKEMLKEDGTVDVVDVKEQTVPDFDCSKGPK